MDERTSRDILLDLIHDVDPDGGNVGEVAEDLAEQYSVSEEEVLAIWKEATKL